MGTFAELEEFRKSEEAIVFADHWIEEQRAGNVTSDWHMNLLAWTSSSQPQALGIVLTLLDRAAADDVVLESIAMGPVQQIVEWPSDELVPFLRESVRTHPSFELCTRSKRRDAQTSRWLALAQKSNS